MKTKFFLCMRPPVIETEDGDYIKLSPTLGSSYTTVSGKTSRRRRDPRQRKTVVQEKHIGQLSIIKSNINNTPENQVKSLFNEDSLRLKKLSTRISNNKVSGGPKSNIGGCVMMVSSLFFTMCFGKLFGIMCTLVLVCSLYSHRRNDVIGDRMTSEKVVVKWPEEGSPEEYKKRVIMAGLLERKSHYNYR